MTMQDLKQYKHITLEIVNLKERINQNTRVTDVVMGSLAEPPFIKHPISITGCSCSSNTLERRFKKDLKILVKQAEEIEDFIENIDDSLNRQILRLRYIDGLSWEHMSFKLNYSSRQIRRLHNAAINKLEM